MNELRVELLSAGRWNATVSELSRKLSIVFAGRDAEFSERHPWHIVAEYSRERETWLASVFPGFVNGSEVEVPAMPVEFAPLETVARLEALGDEATEVRPWLSDLPAFAVSEFRRLGSDADPATEPEPVPPYFRAFGVGSAPALVVDDGNGVEVSRESDGVSEDRRRYLRACEAILYIPRPYPVAIETADGVDVVLRPGDGLPRVSFRSRWVPALPATSALDLLAGAARGYDEISLGTLFLLSPPGKGRDEEPGGEWTPYVRHDLFWNLAFAYQMAVGTIPALNLSLPSGLAAGIASGIFDSLLAPVNEADAVASRLLSRTSVQTEYWTL